MTPPLDLRAVEARLAEDTGPERREQWRQDARTLLAHCRALRAALIEMLDPDYKWSPTREGESTRSTRAAAVLAQVTDQEGR